MAFQSLKLSIGSLTSFIIVLVALWYVFDQKTSLNVSVESTLKGLLEIEKKVSVNHNAKIAVGYGSCVDIVAQSKDVIIDHSSPPNNPIHYESISNEEQLLNIFAYFFKRGAAAE